ncbi:unnamed protein product [Ranitomeya imitator]|uniref:Epoxide hydrolase N-terminal domain-containing protein n=1 Tax=Ranitomeya imitator TaxID=111125 RepID=A0ABN9MNB8_9NEOB|nr:unnamed protein product [Ranitomeya imitator]
MCWKLHGWKVKTLELGEGWWGPGEKPLTHGDDTRLRPFVIEASLADIEDLHRRLDDTRFFPPLEDSRFCYGFNPSHLKTVISYWRNKYDWSKQVEILNKYPHYKTTIEGLDIHFIHVKPSHLSPGQKVHPLLMVHGWPGSFYEFYHILPMLTDPGNHGLDPNIVFEVICPSIPGYGFSEAPSKQGFSAFAAAQIFYKLMLRLGFKEFYLQGGDWGSRITTLLSQMKPQSVKGLHLNFVILPTGGLARLKSLLIGRYLPWLVWLTREDVRRLYPYMEKNVFRIMRETGYLHIQATKPDTIGQALSTAALWMRKHRVISGHGHMIINQGAGSSHLLQDGRCCWRPPGKLSQEGLLPSCPCRQLRPHELTGSALNDSPAGLAAYILEKFSTWTEYSFTDLEDGGLDKKFSLDDLLTNVMIYWITGSITSSMRFYKENFPRDYNRTPDTKQASNGSARHTLSQSISTDTLSQSISTGQRLCCSCVQLTQEYTQDRGLCAHRHRGFSLGAGARRPRCFAKQKFRHIVSYTYMPRGGHFAAFEEPELLARIVTSRTSCPEWRRCKGGKRWRPSAELALGGPRLCPHVTVQTPR